MSHSSGSPVRNAPILGKLWQRLEALPKPVPEDSLLLRVLVQALVIVGIIATDVASEQLTPFSYWAVPLSIVGATWSWYHRRDRNVAVKFILAILMLGAMVLFFKNLLIYGNDTRLVLAELLIQLQILHSFDLPRRQDLGYSMVIGLILLGVAATLSQTLAFAPLLLIFLVIALPTLVLDYRSRLGLNPLLGGRNRSHPSGNASLLTLYTALSPKRLGLILLFTIGLGLVIFISLPRLPGYQLRTLPVTPPPGMMKQDQRFQQDPGTISNPGYIRQPKRGAGELTDEGQGASNKSGKIDPEFYYGFNTQMDQNLRGEMKPKVVLRVRSQAAGFWRVLGFDEYTGQGWKLSREGRTALLTRLYGYRFDVFRLPTLTRKREVIQTYTVVAPLPNIIPALVEPSELYFPTQEVAIDTEGALRSPLELTEGLTYSVISQVPYRDRTILRETSILYPKHIRQHYLQIPPEIADRVRQRTEEILATSEKPLTSVYEKALYLTQKLKQLYTLQPELPFFEMNEDMVTAFLFNYEGGYPDHFSTALTMMLRSIGIPSRLAVGFGPGEFNPFTGLYLVRNTDAYAVTEVYFPEYGWFAFDPIPGHDLYPPTIEDYENFSVLKQFWNWVAGWLPSPVRSGIGAIIEAIAQFLSWLWALVFNGWLGFFTGLILAVAASFVGWLGWQQWRGWRRHRWLTKLPPVERLYHRMLDTLKQRGYAKHPAQTPLEYAQAAHHQHSPEVATAIDDISQAYVRWRYGGETVDLETLKQRLELLVKQTKPLSQLRQRR